MSNFTGYLEEYKLPNKLSKEELNKLFNDFHSGSNEAKEKLIMHNLRLVTYRVYGRFRDIEYNKSDLTSIGEIGLIKAINTYDINKGVDFASYATKCIDNEIMTFMKKKQNNVFVDSLDREILYDDKDIKLGDTIASDVDIEEEYINNEKKIIVREILESLSEKEREIIKLYFGFYGKIYKQIEIAKMLNVSQTFISRLISRTIKKIRTMFNELGYDINNLNSEEKHK